MATILYLDVDDEITSAAARIRGAPETKVALVLPAGSRLATSRINFRLLAREALERNRVLSIVAADPAARAIAASAGLPVHATVAEFEAAIAPPPSAPPAVEPAPPAAEPDALDAAPPVRGRSRKRAAAAGAAAAAAAGSGAADAGALAAGSSSEATSVMAGGGSGVAPVAAGVTRPEQLSADLGTAIEASAAAPTTSTAPTGSETRARSGAATMPVMATTTVRRAVPGGFAISLGVIAVVALVIAVVGYLILPQATVTVTPVAVPVGPVDFTVRADPDATSIDPVGGVIPATRLSEDFAASGEFKATGERVVQKKATGQVTFSSENTFVPVTVPAGTSVRTGSGVAFVTTQEVTIPRASFATGPARRNAPIAAVKAGPAGNVDPGTIIVAPSDIADLLAGGGVTNRQATSGGSRETFTQVSDKDIEAAMASLTKDLEGQFDAWAAAPSDLPAGSTAFPATGQLSTPIPSVDPSTLVGKEQTTFDLAATATGTVVAVDTSKVDEIAAERIAANIPADHALQTGSVEATHDGGQADGDLVDFQVSAKAAAIPVLDPATLRDEIKGKPVAEARRLLERYGTVAIDTWPGFVSSIPTLDFRLDLKVAGAEGVPDASPPPSAVPSASVP